MRRVLHDPGAEAGGEPFDGLGVEHQSSHVHGNDSRHAGFPGEPRGQATRAQPRDRPLGIRRGHVRRDRIAVHEQGNRAEVTNDLRRGGERHRGNEHRLPRFEAEGLQRQVQRGGAGIDGDRGPRPDRRRELFLEAAHPGTGRQPAGPEDFGRFLDFFFGDLRPKERNRGHHLGIHEPRLLDSP